MAVKTLDENPGYNMQILRTGIILNVEKFDECVNFYRDLFDLEVLFEQRSGDFRLTCLEFGGSYLMIENDGVAKPEGKSITENATKLRFNVDDINEALQKLKYFGIDAKIERFEWGSTINIFDPDGNRISIRDGAKFMAT